MYLYNLRKIYTSYIFGIYGQNKMFLKNKSVLALTQLYVYIIGY